MKILYSGPEKGTALQRIRALRRLGHEVTVVDPYLAIPTMRLPAQLFAQWVYRAGTFGFAWWIRKYILSQVGAARFDFVLVDHGELLDGVTIGALKKIGKVVANYNQDNPYVSRDGQKWRLFLKALPNYDLIATHRISSAQGAERAGAKRILLVREAADEAVHRPIDMSDADRARFSADVAFVGTWMPERGPFMMRLVERGVPLRIYGARWNKAPEYERLKQHIVLGNLDGDDYVKAIRGASIAIGLLSKGNEDLHTTRSFEIPAIGTLFCAERTTDHLEMYKDGEEAIFFDSPDECADLCLSLLAHPQRIKKIAAAGFDRVRRNGDFNEKLLTKIIDATIKA
jgi:spore maturation protein CgeB